MGILVDFPITPKKLAYQKIIQKFNVRIDNDNQAIFIFQGKECCDNEVLREYPAHAAMLTIENLKRKINYHLDKALEELREIQLEEI